MRNDVTEDIDESHVMAFLDYCAKERGKMLSDAQAAAKNICDRAKANATPVRPYLEALNGELTSWYKGL